MAGARKIWISLKRLDLLGKYTEKNVAKIIAAVSFTRFHYNSRNNSCNDNDNDDTHINQKVTNIDIRDDHGAEEIKATLKEAFCLQGNSLVLKLRNHRGSLIPISSNIPSNSKSVPYTLEVVEMYQNVKPKPRSIKRNRLNETMKKKVLEMMDRIEKLEKNMPELNQRRDTKIVAEMEILEKKLGFLNKRFMEAESSDWKGMFKKNPLW